MQRQTTQRRAIRQCIEDADRPLSPAEVHAAAAGKVPKLGLATVYRALAAMKEEGQLAVVSLPGEAPRYELAGKPHHHHFHCRQCDRVYELNGCPGDLKRLAPEKFVVESHEVVLYGLCPGCAETR
jgi:Fur family ferric uptake transcriptional regulator